MWARKPHTKKHKEDRQNRNSRVRDINVMSHYQNNLSTSFNNNNNGTHTTNSKQRGGENRNNGTQNTSSAQRSRENLNNETQSNHSAQRCNFSNRRFSGVNDMGEDITSSGNRNINDNPAWRTRFGGVNGFGEDTTSSGHRNINNNPALRTNINNDGKQYSQKDGGIKRRSLWVLSGTI